jgi:hypothetical protein
MKIIYLRFLSKSSRSEHFEIFINFIIAAFDLNFAFIVFQDLDLLTEFNIDSVVMRNFLLSVRKNYRANPFHNWSDDYFLFFMFLTSRNSHIWGSYLLFLVAQVPWFLSAPLRIFAAARYCRDSASFQTGSFRCSGCLALSRLGYVAFLARMVFCSPQNSI